MLGGFGLYILEYMSTIYKRQLCGEINFYKSKLACFFLLIKCGGGAIILLNYLLYLKRYNYKMIYTWHL